MVLNKGLNFVFALLIFSFVLPFAHAATLSQDENFSSILSLFIIVVILIIIIFILLIVLVTSRERGQERLRNAFLKRRV